MTEENVQKFSILYNIDVIKETIKEWEKEKLLSLFGFYIDDNGEKKSYIPYHLLLILFPCIVTLCVMFGLGLLSVGLVLTQILPEIIILSILGELITFTVLLSKNLGPYASMKNSLAYSRKEINHNLKELKVELLNLRQKLKEIDMSKPVQKLEEPVEGRSSEISIEHKPTIITTSPKKSICNLEDPIEKKPMTLRRTK